MIVCIAQFMVVLDATVVNVALPAIQEDLDFSASSLQWVVNAYTLAFGGFLLLGGRAADFIGRRRLFIAGVVVFTGASLLNGLAQSSEFLIAARALQGLGAAMVSPAALSIVTTTFRDGAERAKALSVWAAIAVGGAAVGLLARRPPHRVPRRGSGSSSSTCRSASSRSLLGAALRARVEGAERPRRRRRRARSASPPA